MRCLRFYIIIVCVTTCGALAYTAHGAGVQKTFPDTSVLRLWIKTADNYFEANKYDSAEYYLKRAGDLAGQKHLDKYYLEYTARYARLLFKQLRYKEALKISQQQLKLALRINDIKSAANAYNNISIQYRVLGNLELAADNMIKALKVSEKLNEPGLLRRYYSNLASIFLDLKDNKNSLYYARKSYDIALQSKDSTQISLSIINLAISEVNNNQINQAIVHLDQLKSISEKLKDSLMIVDASINLGDIYNKQGQFSKALKLYEKALNILKRNPSTDYEMYTLFGLANCYTSLKDYAKAEHYFNKTLGYAGKLMPKNDLKEVYVLGAEIFENNGRPAMALGYYKKYAALNDSILTAHTEKVTHELEIKYQTSLKEQAIDKQKLQISEKNIQLQRSKKYVAFSIAAVILLAAISVIVYMVSRYKNQSIELSLLKSQIHPHFLFNTLNNLYALSLKKSDESPRVVMGLAEILKYILYECNSPLVSLQQEIYIIERYIELERIRYKNTLEVNVSIQGDISNCKIVPLLLLPLVENSFKHGISKLEEDGWINIEVNIADQWLTFKISNNKPVTNIATRRSSKYGNIGLYNIKKRLNILYRHKHAIDIVDEEDIFIVLLKVNLKESNRLNIFKR
ncbi:tetratricopeptide repeat protein [Mucilaginibacter litoreus]|uniref:Tetratricopeptide repeat protein n=1 Tax=Mucilaginibacter litoreus TaxID=1048221 RepID=A0ABW3AQD2_9SPHI